MGIGIGSHPTRKLGRKHPVHDKRIRPLTHALTRPVLPPPPASISWHTKMPAAGEPMLWNDTIGDCVAASICHYVGNSSCYTAQHVPLLPTPDEALKIYEGSGYQPTNPNGPPDSNDTDQGWVMLGHGGAIEAWTKGFTIGGKLNKLNAAPASVNFRNPVEMRQAIALFGFVLTGATLSNGDASSDYLWDKQTHAGEIDGGHEFITCGYREVNGMYYYDVITWNGLWCYTEDWLLSAVDEALVVYNDVFFDIRGLDGAGIDKSVLRADLAGFTGVA